MEVVIAALIAWIVANTGMVAPPPPPVLYVPQAHLQEMLYREKGTNRGGR